MRGPVECSAVLFFEVVTRISACGVGRTVSGGTLRPGRIVRDRLTYVREETKTVPGELRRGINMRTRFLS